MSYPVLLEQVEMNFIVCWTDGLSFGVPVRVGTS